MQAGNRTELPELPAASFYTGGLLYGGRGEEILILRVSRIVFAIAQGAPSVEPSHHRFQLVRLHRWSQLRKGFSLTTTCMVDSGTMSQMPRDMYQWSSMLWFISNRRSSGATSSHDWSFRTRLSARKVSDSMLPMARVLYASLAPIDERCEQW